MIPFETVVIAFLLSFITVVIATPFVRRLALQFDIVDHPEKRKVHNTPVATLGGVAILLGAAIGFFYLSPFIYISTGIVSGLFLIVLLGVIDDLYDLSARTKMAGQIVAALCAVASGVIIPFIHFPFYGNIEFGIFSIIMTILWIVGITNAVNFIDGLDGLAAGVTAIALLMILLMSIVHQLYTVLPFVIILLGSILGFLPYNFHPANIFMGDTGSMFLGYTISILAIDGFLKSVTLFSLIVPIMILGVPLLDTFFAILRRLLNREKISKPDKRHLHHRLLEIGFTHRSAVFLIYLVSFLFGIIAIIFSTSSFKSALVILFFLIAAVYMTAEAIGLFGEQRQPLLYALKKIRKKPQNSS